MNVKEIVAVKVFDFISSVRPTVSLHLTRTLNLPNDGYEITIQ